MRLYNIGSKERTTNSYSGKWGACCYLDYELETSLHDGETVPRFVNTLLDTSKASTLNIIVRALRPFATN
jgi:hypothetical protein